MFQNVKIGEQEVPMLAMASVDHYYQVIFHEDPVALQADGKAQTPEGTIHFPRGALLDALADIRAVYDGEQLPSVAAKKNSDDPSGA